MENKKKIHFIGIGGIGVSALAGYYLSRGAAVSGSDVKASPITDGFKNKGAEIYIGHSASNIASDVDLVIHTAAAAKDNPELIEAQSRGIKIQSYAQALGELTKKMKTIAVSGMHGKSTTTAMLGLALEKAGLDPTVIVGTKLKEWGGNNFRLGQSDLLVIEADEYDRSLLNYWPQILVLLNIEEEHLDTYGNLDNILETFEEYVGHLPENGWLVANGEDENIEKISNFPTRLRSRQAISNKITNSKLQIKKFNSQNNAGLKLKVPGEHNIFNANAVLAVCEILGVDRQKAIEVLNEFSGTWRRMEYKGEVNGAKIYDDYGHHPTEIKATLAAAKELVPAGGRLWVIFQPHQYQRTYRLFDQFVGAFDAADKAILLPIYSVAGRETEEIKQKTSSEKLAQVINEKGGNIQYLDSFEKARDFLKGELKAGDVAFVMGAGDIYQLTEMLLK